MERWVEQHGHTKGVTVLADTVLHLGRAWYNDPRVPGWRPRTRDESQAILHSFGLTGEFWALPSPV